MRETLTFGDWSGLLTRWCCRLWAGDRSGRVGPAGGQAAASLRRSLAEARPERQRLPVAGGADDGAAARVPGVRPAVPSVRTTKDLCGELSLPNWAASLRGHVFSMANYR